MKKYFSLTRRFIAETDKILLLLIAAASTFGVMMVHSATRFRLGEGETIYRDAIVMIIAALWKSRVNFSFGYILKTFASGLNWYLYAYLGFLFMLPFLRNIVNNSTKDKTTLFFGLTLGFYSLQALPIVFGMNFSLFSNVPLFNSYYASSCWMIIFPIAGYYVANADSIYTDKKELYKFRSALIISSVVSVAVSIILITYDIKNNGGNNLEQLRQHFIFAPSCLIFYLCKIVVDKYQHRITKIPARSTRPAITKSTPTDIDQSMIIFTIFETIPDTETCVAKIEVYIFFPLFSLKRLYCIFILYYISD